MNDVEILEKFQSELDLYDNCMWINQKVFDDEKDTLVIDYGGSGNFPDVFKAISEIIDEWTYSIDEKIGGFGKSLQFTVDSGREKVEVTLRNEC